MVAPGTTAACTVQTPQGLWAEYGAPASVDWCEPNYAVVHEIAEFWNTVSSVPLALVGLFALWRLYRADWAVETRFVLCFIGLVAVGLGSTAFHATLLQASQALDELPMVYCSLVMTYCVVVRTLDTTRDASTVRAWQLAFTLYAIAFTATYFLSPDYFFVFIASFAGVVTYLVIQGWRVVFRLSTSRPLRRLYTGAATAFISGVTLFWLPERGLPCHHDLQALHLHVWWHLLALVGTHVGFLVVLYDRLLTQERAPSVTGRVMPWVSPGR